MTPCPTPDPLSRQLAEAADRGELAKRSGPIQKQIDLHTTLRLIDAAAERRRKIPLFDPDPIDEPLLIAFVGGPGTGKSTTAALAFGALKQQGYNVELVGEVAKDFTWEERHVALSHQAYIAAKQMRNYDRLTGKVDAILTDTSTLLSLIYGPLRYGTPDQAFRDWIKIDWRCRRTLDILLKRDPRVPYNPAGRRQSEAESIDLDRQIESLLLSVGTLPLSYDVDRSEGRHIDLIVERVKEHLDGA